jgi:ABC-type multidrug transport system ATPase subunit
MTTRIIETRSFHFSYPGSNRPAVRDLTFSVERGEIFGCLGPSEDMFVQVAEALGD